MVKGSMNNMSGVETARDEARNALHIYQSRTGLSLREVADRAGYAPQSIKQFSSGGRYGDGDGGLTAKALMDFFAANPPPGPELPGKLYETECSGKIDQMLSYVGRGRWGTLYGPAGAQKSFVLEYRAAQAAQEAEPSIVYVECSPRLTPTALLRRIAAGLGAPYAQSREDILQSVLFTLRRRRAPVAVVIDEAQHLYRGIDTLETVRDVGDKSHGKAGILICGNERVLEIFAPRGGMYFEQWRSRIEQKSLRLLGLSRAEAREIVRAELGQLKPETVEVLVGAPVRDPETKREYFSARRLFNAIRDFREKRGVS
jgi:type II secretory pathway predicted ATPase ExeA